MTYERERPARPTGPADPLTPAELLKAAQFLFAMADSVERDGGTTLTLPTRTARRLGDAILAVCNA